MKRALLLTAILILLFACTSFAAVKTFVREYSYEAGEADSKLSSRAIALEQVKRLLIEELGTYLESQTEVKNFQITRDQITTLSAGVVQTIILDEKWDGKDYWMKAKIEADPDKVVAALNELRNDRRKSEELAAAKKTADDALAEIARLKEALSGKDNAAAKKAAKANVSKAAEKLTAKDWLDKGQYLAGVKAYTGAIAAYDKALKLDPNMALAYTFRASSKMMVADFNGALADCNKAIEIDPQLAFSYVIRGWAEGGLGNFELAIKDCDTAIVLEPQMPLAHYMRGWAKFSSQDYLGAIKDLDQAITLDPRFAWAYVWRAGSKMMLADYNGALADCNKAIEIDPTIAQAYVYRGWAKGGLGNFESALKDCETAIGLDPKLAEGYHMRGWIKGSLGYLNEAITDLDRGLTLNPKMGWSYFFRAGYKAALGDTAGSDQDYIAAARLGVKEAQQVLTKKGISW